MQHYVTPMHEPPIQFDPVGDARPVWLYLAALMVLLALPWLGVECLFGWCVVQSDSWVFYSFALALPVLLFLEFPLRLVDRMRGIENDDHMTEDSPHKSRRGFWPGLLIGIIAGAGLLLLVGLVLWNPPF